MKYLRFTSLFVLLAMGLLIPWVTKGQISAQVADPVDFAQPVVDDAVSIASENVVSDTPNHETTLSTAQQSEELEFPEPNLPAVTATPSGYPNPTPVPLDSINVHAMAGQESINVSWELDGPFAGNLHSYALLRNQNGGDFVLIGSSSNTQYTDDDSSLMAGIEYCYQVKALNIIGYAIATSDIACASFGSLTILVPDQVVEPNGTNVPVTINLANGNGLCVRALDIKLEYDHTIVKANNNVSQTVFTQGYAFEATTQTPGEIKISAIIGQGCEDHYGGGSLFDVFFNVIGPQGSVSQLDFIKGLTGTVIYDEDLFSPVDLTPQNGSLTVAQNYIRGDVNGDEVVNAADAALALDIANGRVTPTAQQSGACDVNGDGACNSADSTLILCFAVSQDWAQCGGVESAKRVSQRNAQPNGDPVVVRIGELNQNGSTLTVPVEISNATDMAGGNFSFMYDGSKMSATGASLTSLTNGFELQTNSQQAGILKVSLARDAVLGSNGAIFELKFNINNGISSIGIGSVTLNNDAGQDFATSALQREIQLFSYTNFDATNFLYLPAVID